MLALTPVLELEAGSNSTKETFEDEEEDDDEEDDVT